MCRYGLGAEHEFAWYFEGESTVPISSIHELKDWLLTCEYVRDHDLFQTEDYWQHPRLFEVLQKGDCEDFAIWTWRKLVRMGFEAEFVVGWWSVPYEEPAAHAWVHFEKEGERFLFDPVVPCKSQMCRPWHHVHLHYLPEVSVGHDFTRYLYTGHFLREKWRCPEAYVGSGKATLYEAGANVVHRTPMPA